MNNGLLVGLPVVNTGVRSSTLHGTFSRVASLGMAVQRPVTDVLARCLVKERQQQARQIKPIIVRCVIAPLSAKPLSIRATPGAMCAINWPCLGRPFFTALTSIPCPGNAPLGLFADPCSVLNSETIMHQIKQSHRSSLLLEEEGGETRHHVLELTCESRGVSQDHGNADTNFHMVFEV